MAMTEGERLRLVKASFDAGGNGKIKKLDLTVKIKRHSVRHFMLLDMHYNGRSIRYIANKMGIGSTTVHRWLKNSSKTEYDRMAKYFTSKQELTSEPELSLTDLKAQKLYMWG